MIEIAHDDTGARSRPSTCEGSSQLPDALPVLPLRETVAFPNTMTPLAVGQERSVQLVNDVLSGDRMLVMVASKDPEVERRAPTTSTGSASPASSRGC